MEQLKLQLYLSGIFSKDEISTLTPSQGFVCCDFCSRKLRCGKVSCEHRFCVDCLDNLHDIKTMDEIECPLCQTTINNVSYIY